MTGDAHLSAFERLVIASMRVECHADLDAELADLREQRNTLRRLADRAVPAKGEQS